MRSDKKEPLRGGVRQVLALRSVPLAAAAQQCEAEEAETGGGQSARLRDFVRRTIAFTDVAAIHGHVRRGAHLIAVVQEAHNERAVLAAGEADLVEAVAGEAVAGLHHEDEVEDVAQVGRSSAVLVGGAQRPLVGVAATGGREQPLQTETLVRQPFVLGEERPGPAPDLVHDRHVVVPGLAPVAVVGELCPEGNV